MLPQPRSSPTSARVASSSRATRYHTASCRGPPTGDAYPAAAQLRRYRILLNSNVSGPQAFFFLAHDRGYLKAAGLDAEFVGGDGAAAVVARIGPEGFDFGYGDLNALVPLVARGVPNAPIAVYVTFNVFSDAFPVPVAERITRLAAASR